MSFFYLAGQIQEYVEFETLHKIQIINNSFTHFYNMYQSRGEFIHNSVM